MKKNTRKKAVERQKIKFPAGLKVLSFFAAAGVMTVLDQFTKRAAAEYLREPLELFTGASLKYAENTGIAWSIQLPYAFLLFINFFLIGLFFWWAMRSLEFNRWLTVAVIALVTAGAAGNMIDRIGLGYVVDFISVGFWPVFNLADAFLSIGIFLILLFYAKINRTG